MANKYLTTQNKQLMKTKSGREQLMEKINKLPTARQKVVKSRIRKWRPRKK